MTSNFPELIAEAKAKVKKRKKAPFFYHTECADCGHSQKHVPAKGDYECENCGCNEEACERDERENP